MSREPNRPPHQSASGICIESRWLHAHIHLVIGPDQDPLDARKGPGPTPHPRPARPSRPSRAGRGRSRGCGVRETPGGGGAGSLIQADGISPDGIAGAVTGLGRLVIAARVVCAATRRRSSLEGGPRQEQFSLLAGAHMDRVDRQIAAWGRQGALFRMPGKLLPSASRLKRSSRPGNDFQKLAGSHRLEPACSPSSHRPAADRRRRAGGAFGPLGDLAVAGSPHRR